MCFKMLFPIRCILSICTSLIVYQFQRSSLFGRIYFAFLVLLKSLFEVPGKSYIEITVFLTPQHVCIIHQSSNNFTG